MDEERRVQQEDATQAHEKSMKKYTEIRKLEKELKTLTSQLKAFQGDMEQREGEKQGLIRAKVKLDIDVKESEDKKGKEDARKVCNTAFVITLWSY